MSRTFQKDVSSVCMRVCVRVCVCVCRKKPGLFHPGLQQPRRDRALLDGLDHLVVLLPLGVFWVSSAVQKPSLLSLDHSADFCPGGPWQGVGVVTLSKLVGASGGPWQGAHRGHVSPHKQLSSVSSELSQSGWGGQVRGWVQTPVWGP